MADTDADLPKAAVKKVVKQGLPPGQPDAQGRPRETHVNKDALLAFTEGAQVWERKVWHEAQAGALGMSTGLPQHAMDGFPGTGRLFDQRCTFMATMRSHEELPDSAPCHTLACRP